MEVTEQLLLLVPACHYTHLTEGQLTLIVEDSITSSRYFTTEYCSFNRTSIGAAFILMKK